MLLRPRCIHRRVSPFYSTLALHARASAPLHVSLCHPVTASIHGSRSHKTYATHAQHGPDTQVALPPRPDLNLDRGSRRQPDATATPCPNKDVSPFSREELEKELRWIQDPLKLANKTKTYLVKKNDELEFQKAVALVRHASRKMPCIVSWNHLINHRMNQGNVSAALRLYNDMKKRAQPPDAFTYTTLFTGLARNSKFSLSAERALSIYQSMFADNSPVKPNLTHTNAVLNVCALCGNTDAMLGVAAQLPQQGKGAPDKFTYTTILNAIRVQTLEKLGHEPHDAVEVRDRALRQGSRLWDEIKARWSEGELSLDEELVCAMGRLLLISPQSPSHHDILPLLEQTMRIPQPALPATESKRQARLEAPESALLAAKSQSESLKLQQADKNKPILGELLPTQYYPRPGTKTLSLIMQTCTELRLFQAAQNYWGLLTARDTFDIEPDKQNYLDYLRLLRLQHQSRMTVELIRELKDGLLKFEGLEPKFFRIALSTCLRDVNNQHALDHASQLVKMMSDTLETPDPAALVSYLAVATTRKPRAWLDIYNTAHSLIVPMRLLRSDLVYLFAKIRRLSDSEEHASVVEREGIVLALAKKMIEAFDIAVKEGRETMSKDQRNNCRLHKDWLWSWCIRRQQYKRAEANVRNTSRRGKAKSLHDEKVEANRGWTDEDGSRQGGRLARFSLEKRESSGERQAA